MKKLPLLLILGTVGIALGDSVDLFAPTITWNYGNIGSGNSLLVDTNEKKFGDTDPSWSYPYATHTFGTPYDLSQSGSSLSFNVIIGTSTGDNHTNCLATLSLLSDSAALVTGWGGYNQAPGNKGIQVGIKNNISESDHWFRFQEKNKTEGYTGTVANTVEGILFSTDTYFQKNSTVIMHGTLKANGDNTWTFSLACDNAEAQSITVTSEQGDFSQIDKLVLSLGGGKGNYTYFKDLTVEYTAAPTPEPTSGMLFLLTPLCGLLRRKR